VAWWQRFNLFSGLVASLLSKDDVDEDEVERLKEGDILETTFAEFAEDRQDLYLPLIDERDRYMAARLLEDMQNDGHKSILAVIGAGHMRGIKRYLEEGIDSPRETVVELDAIPKKKSWPKLIPWIIVALILSGFAIGFSRSPEIGWSLVADWVLINGGLSALGALLAGAHPITTIAGWWRNRVSRTLLVFLFSTFGSAIGTYLAGFKIFGQLAG